MNRLFSGFWLKAFLSLTLSIVVIATSLNVFYEVVFYEVV